MLALAAGVGPLWSEITDGLKGRVLLRLFLHVAVTGEGSGALNNADDRSSAGKLTVALIRGVASNLSFILLSYCFYILLSYGAR